MKGHGNSAGATWKVRLGKSNVAITLDIDSNIDSEKLAKLVKVLKDSGFA